MTTPQNNVKSVSALDLEDFVINLDKLKTCLTCTLSSLMMSALLSRTGTQRKRALRRLCMPHARICFKPS